MLPSRQTLEAEVCWKKNKKRIIYSKVTHSWKNDGLLSQSPLPVKQPKTNYPTTFCQISSKLHLEFLYPFKMLSFGKRVCCSMVVLAAFSGSQGSGTFLKSAHLPAPYLLHSARSSAPAHHRHRSLWPSAGQYVRAGLDWAAPFACTAGPTCREAGDPWPSE